MNCLSIEKRTQVVSALIEGNSVRATVRMTGVSEDTVLKLLVDLGTGSRRSYHNSHVRNAGLSMCSAMRFGISAMPRPKNAPDDKKALGGAGG